MSRPRAAQIAALLLLAGAVSGTHAHELRPERAPRPAMLLACPLGCDDQNPCTDDVCDAELGCLHTNNTSPCSDSQNCTTNDVCVGGACVGGDPGPGCASCSAVATIPAGGGTFVGTTSGSGTLGGSCATSGAAPERVYSFTPATSGTASADTCDPGTSFDTVLHVRADACAGAEVACDDDETCPGAPASSRVSFAVQAGQTYYIVVDGYVQGHGSFVLHVLSPGSCGNGIREGDEECDGADLGVCGTGSCTPSCTCTVAGGALPDLVPEIMDWLLQFDASVDPGDVAEGCAEAVSGVDLLRFGVRTHNAGTGNLFLGDPGCPAPCTDHPLEICANTNFICSPAGGHNHGHYLDYARYELLDAAQNTLVVGHKQGFCLKDGQDAGPCPNPQFTCTYQGISVGCADLYESALGCQYLDITGIPSGSYTLRVSIDPLGKIHESDEDNNVVSVPVTISRDACAEPTTIPPGGGAFTGTTSGASTKSGTCASTDHAPERVFVWTPATSGTARFETCSATGTDFDTVLYVRSGSCNGPQLACNDDGPCATSNSVQQASRINLAVSAGQTYFIFVDGYDGASGNFTLSVTPPACTPAGSPCDDGDPCTSADVCVAGACAGTPAAPPPEVNDSLRVERVPEQASISWNDSPGPFNVYRGATSLGTDWTYDQSCLAAGSGGSTVVDTADPPSSAFYWYLVTRTSACGESIPGRKGDGSPIPPGAPCP